ncbi:MAG TPA: proton-conducting transporter membrane subunit [Flavobacteriales bacterium]|nr:proton-conducting transporter membrane subunit [Flavobacteriales bacterium]
MMNLVLPLFVLIPAAGFLASLVIKRRAEMALSRVAYLTAAAQVVLVTGYIIAWALEGFDAINVKELTVYQSKGYEFFIDLYFDHVTAVYLFMGAILTFLITVYSRYYLHREEGYKRFFNTILFFFTGYSLTVLAGNFETLFLGWEMLGLSSFLLIGFYRDRYLPVKNSVKVFSIYRVGDVGLLLAMWMSHHLWHENITFHKLHNYVLVHDQLADHSLVGIFISLAVLLAAAAKSAQLPFSSWLPRAMEGPTPSSAIFYGSLSVHIGVFLLLRTFPFWEHQFSVRVLIGVLGLATSLMAAGTARVQSSVKAQIAYSSIAQIGLIFIEVALGLELIALIHFMGNAFLRTYQLLVSPSVVTYLIREQFYHFTPRERTFEDTLPKRLEYTLYMLCLREWDLDTFMYRRLWNPMKRLGRNLDALNINRSISILLPLYIAGIVALWQVDRMHEDLRHALPAVMALLSMVLVLRAFTERKHVRRALTMVIMGHFWVALAISFNGHFDLGHTLIYLSGVVLCGVLAVAAINRLRRTERIVDLGRFHGHSFEHPRLAFVFLLACLGLAGFPITPTFLGEDLIFSHIHHDQLLLAGLVAFSFVLNGLALIRIYARVFLGRHVKTYHEVAYRSA